MTISWVGAYGISDLKRGSKTKIKFILKVIYLWQNNYHEANANITTNNPPKNLYHYKIKTSFYESTNSRKAFYISWSQFLIFQKIVNTSKPMVIKLADLIRAKVDRETHFQILYFITEFLEPISHDAFWNCILP